MEKNRRREQKERTKEKRRKIFERIIERNDNNSDSDYADDGDAFAFSFVPSFRILFVLFNKDQLAQTTQSTAH